MRFHELPTNTQFTLPREGNLIVYTKINNNKNNNVIWKQGIATIHGGAVVNPLGKENNNAD